MDDNFVVFGAPDIQQPEIDEVVDSLLSGWLGTGPKVKRFERDFAEYKGVNPSHAVALNSCTAALHVSMVAAGIKPGDEVITTAMTFCATANAAIHVGAVPVPVDIEADSLNMDPRLIENSITRRTKAIVPVHFAGRPCDMDAITSIATKHDLVVIEDCAHAIETMWRGRTAGSIGDFGCFSFYATKNVVTGEGGMMIAKSAEAADLARALSLHGLSSDAWQRFGGDGYKHYQVVEAGFKYNMMDLQAAIGIHQLARIEKSWARRRKIWTHYQNEFQALPIGTPADPRDDIRHAYHLYTITIDRAECPMTRDEFIAAMSSEGIGVGVHYVSLAQHRYFQDRFGWRSADFPVADAFGSKTVSLPLSAKLSDAEVELIVETVKQLVAN